MDFLLSVLIGMCIGIAVVLLITLLISYIFFHMAFKRKKLKEYEKQEYDTDKSEYFWYEEKNNEDVSIKSHDNLNLTAKLIKSDRFSHLYLIIVHGYHGCYTLRMPIAKAIYERYNLNVLAINLRGHYTSKGKYHSLSYNESKDLLLWINYVKSIDKEAKIILDGVSMGSATIMQDLDKLDNSYILGAICDCGFYSLKEEIEREYKKVAKILLPFSSAFLPLFFKLRYKIPIKNVNCFKGLSEAKVPTMLIHAHDDPVIPFSDYLKCKSVLKENDKNMFLEFETGGHARTFYRHNEEYKEKLFEFLDRIIVK